MFCFSGGNKIFNSTRREGLGQNLTITVIEILGRWQSVANPEMYWTPRLRCQRNFININQASTRFLENVTL
jgi:hypothetical protein